MDYMWNWLWDIIYHFILHLVTFQWWAIAGDRNNFLNWWRTLWGHVERATDWVRDWVEGRISYLSGYAFGLYWQARHYAYDLVVSSRALFWGMIDGVKAWVSGRISYLQGYAFGLFIQVQALIHNLVNLAKAVLYHYIDQAIAWLRNFFGWIQYYKDLIANWLVGARAVIDWLWHYAWGKLQAFLANPIGFVLGWLLSPITNLINWWSAWGPGLMSFVVSDLPRLRNLLARGFSFLSTFVDRPVDTILELLAPVVVDWLAGVVADNW